MARSSEKRCNVAGSKKWFLVTYDQDLGLVPLIMRALGPRKIDLDNFDSDITPERFNLKGFGVRKVWCRVEANLDDETNEQAAKRLTDAGSVLGNPGDLAGFVHDQPMEMRKWDYVSAISEDSRWTDPDGAVNVPVAHVGEYRDYSLNYLHQKGSSDSGVLVVSEQLPNS